MRNVPLRLRPDGRIGTVPAVPLLDRQCRLGTAAPLPVDGQRPVGFGHCHRRKFVVHLLVRGIHVFESNVGVVAVLVRQLAEGSDRLRAVPRRVLLMQPGSAPARRTPRPKWPPQHGQARAGSVADQKMVQIVVLVMLVSSTRVTHTMRTLPITLTL